MPPRKLLPMLLFLPVLLPAESQPVGPPGGSAPQAATSASPWDVAAPVRQWTAKLPSWLKLTGEIRGRSDNYFGLNGTPGRDNSYYLHRLRLNVTVTVAPWLRLVAQGQDSREAGYDRAPVPYTLANPFDLRQGYVEIGLRADDAPWTLRFGRQPLVFGDMRLVSTSNWGNVGPNYDGLRLTVRQPGVRLDGFVSRVVVPGDGFDAPRKDKMLSGFYSSFDAWEKAATFDAYVFWKKNLQTIDLFTYGARSSGRLPYGLDYNVEMALQRGRVAGQPDAAWAGHWEIGHRWRAVRGSPRLAAEYNYATGDQDPHDGRCESFDSLYPTNIYGTAGDFGWRNLHEPAVYLEWQPDKKTKIKTAYHLFWLAETHDALYTASGSVFASAPNATANRVGSEVDVRWIHQMSKSLQLWFGYAHLFPGPYLKQAGKGAVDYPYASWTVNF